MRTRWTVVVGFVLAFFAAGWTTSTASATAPVTLDSGFVTDDAGVLSDADAADANERLEELSAAKDVDLFVVFVDRFTDPSDAQDWADAVAADNGLGANQYLLAVAVEGRNYYISADSTGPLGDARLDDIEAAIQPYLSAEDWTGAIDTAAEEFAADPAAGSLIGVLVVVAVAAAAVLVIWLIVRARRRTRGAQPAVPDPNDPYASVSDEELATQAGSALVRADDAITSSTEELGFAAAQFGEDSTARFGQVVEEAKAKVAEAFSLQQQLDDEVPDSAQQRREWHIQIIQLCDAADDLLEQNAEAFEELRKLEQNAPQALEQVRARRAEAQLAVDAAPGALSALSARYDAAALSTVAENPTHAQERLRLADAAIAEAAQAISANKAGEAAFAIRTAEEAVIQATQLAAAVDRLGADLAAVEQQATALVADLEADLAAAAQLPQAQGELAAVAARTRIRLDDAQRSLQSTPRNPQRALETLDAANTEIDTVIAQVRDAIQLAQRNQQLLAQRLTQAQAQISAGNEFIATRRGAVGATARTRLAEANAALLQALAVQTTDVNQALNLATRAYQLAQEATSLAESEVSSYGAGGLGGGLFGGGGYGGYGGGSGLGGDILGGIIGGILSSGGGGSRGGGRSWRSGGSSRGFRPSGFGGSRGSRGRSGGGRF